MVRRRADWQGALDTFLAEHRLRKFRYGDWDCCLFACDAVKLMTGIDLAEPFRGRYSSAKSARKALKETIGSTSVRQVATVQCAANDMPEVPIMYAQRGDLALVRRKRDFSLGIVALNGRDIVAITPKGLELIPMENAANAWRI